MALLVLAQQVGIPVVLDVIRGGRTVYQQDVPAVGECQDAFHIVRVQLAYLVPEHVSELVKGDIFVAVDPFFKVVYYLQRRIHTHIGCHQGLLYGIEQVIIHTGLPDHSPGEPLEKAALGLLYTFVKYTHIIVLQVLNLANILIKSNIRKTILYRPGQLSLIILF